MKNLLTHTLQAVLEFLPSLAEVARSTSFTHAVHLHETLWRCLPVIAISIGVCVGSGGGGLVWGLVCGVECVEGGTSA